jgi:Tol biopolymer transport system component
MTDDRLHRAISDSLSDLASGSPTDYIEDVLAVTARTRQRPAWTFPGRYLTMTPALRFAAIAILAVSTSIGVAALVSEPMPEAPAVGECPAATASAGPPASLAPGASLEPVVIEDCEPWIAFEARAPLENGEEPRALMAVRPDGSDSHAVAIDRIESYQPDWSHDGGRLAFTRDRDEGGASIWTVNADGTDEQQLVACALPCMTLFTPSWSPDDSMLAVARIDLPPGGGTLGDRCYLETIDVATLERTVILEGPAGTEQVECYWSPRWSGDGRSIVFELPSFDADGRDGSWSLTGSSIAVVDAAGPPDQEPRVLTDPELLATHPDWHPSQDLIVFGTRPLDTFPTAWLATNLYTMRPDGTDIRKVTSYGDLESRATSPTWTPDGEQISFSYIEPTTDDLMMDKGDRQLAFIKPDGSGLRVVPGVNGVEPRVRPLP